MKIRNFFAAAITLLSLGMFVACNSDEEYDETFANNEKILGYFFEEGTITYIAMENVVGVALIEELAKYIVLMLFIWKNEEFDFRYDGIVYAAAASLGFAALENILYLLQFGTDISLGRALFAIPGHTTFSVFMGLYLSRAKEALYDNQPVREKRFKFKALLVPTIVHGIYDFLLDENLQENLYYIFILFVIIIDIIALSIIKHEYKHDQLLYKGKKSEEQFSDGFGEEGEE